MNSKNNDRRGGVRRRPDGRAGIYVHVPVCGRVCPYCDFGVEAAGRERATEIVEAAAGELRERRAQTEGRRAETLYVGGGTPSRAEDGALAELIEAVDTAAGGAAGGSREVSIEANPEDLSEERAWRWGEMGVDRVFLGVQSFQPTVLEALGRVHEADQGRRAVEAAAGAGLSVGIDLMMGVPGQSSGLWRRDLEVLEEMAGAIDVVCGWQLSWDDAVPEAYRERAKRQPDGDAQRRMLEALGETCSELGFERRELAVFARSAAERRHTEGVWQGMEVVAAGPGARGLTIDGSGRVWRYRNADRSVSGELRSRRWEVAPADYLVERLGLGLKWAGGIDREAIGAQFREAFAPVDFRKAIGGLEGLEERGLVRIDADRLRPTVEGLHREAAIWGYLDTMVGRLLK